MNEKFAIVIETLEAAEKEMSELHNVMEGLEQRKELEKQIATIRDGIRLEVADKLAEADSRREFSQLAAQMRDDLLNGFLDW